MFSRKRIGYLIRWLAVIIFFVPYTIIERYSGTRETKLLIFADSVVRNIANKIDAWENNTPEHTMELLKKDFRND